MVIAECARNGSDIGGVPIYSNFGFTSMPLPGSHIVAVNKDKQHIAIATEASIHGNNNIWFKGLKELKEKQEKELKDLKEEQEKDLKEKQEKDLKDLKELKEKSFSTKRKWKNKQPGDTVIYSALASEDKETYTPGAVIYLRNNGDIEITTQGVEDNADQTQNDLRKRARANSKSHIILQKDGGIIIKAKNGDKGGVAIDGNVAINGALYTSENQSLNKLNEESFVKFDGDKVTFKENA